MTGDLSTAEARRVIVDAQGLATSRPTGRVDRRHLRRAMRAMGVVQVDSVQVVARSQDLVMFSRLGAHRHRSLIPDAMVAGELFEYWAHEAAIVPVDQHPLWRWRMAGPFPWPGFRRRVATMGAYLDEVVERIRAEGPLVASDIGSGTGGTGHWWEHDDGKTALAALFFQGRVAANRRPRDFARVYDLPENVISAEVLAAPTPTEHEARKELLLVAATGTGVATLEDLADHHHLTPTLSKAPLAELVEEGRLVEVAVDGWDAPAYMRPGTRVPRAVEARALLSPFDPVVWTRPRAERVFGYHYRIEIYTPAAKRRFGYYVLPFLLGDELVGRVDLKTDRAAGTLRVQSAWVEPGPDPVRVAGGMGLELREMAAWLELDRVEVVDRGDLAPVLARAVG